MIGRSYLLVPGHNERPLAKAFDAGSDAVILDLEDAVPVEHKSRARELVAGILAERQAWVRVNAAFSDLCREDLRAVAASAAGIRIPNVESAERPEQAELIALALRAMAVGIRREGLAVPRVRGVLLGAERLQILLAHETIEVPAPFLEACDGLVVAPQPPGEAAEIVLGVGLGGAITRTAGERQGDVVCLQPRRSRVRAP